MTGVWFKWQTWGDINDNSGTFIHHDQSPNRDGRWYAQTNASSTTRHHLILTWVESMSLSMDSHVYSLMLFIHIFLSLPYRINDDILLELQWIQFILFWLVVSNIVHFHSLHDASVHSAVYNWVPGYRQWWTCEWMVLAHNCCMARMLPREVKLEPEWTGLPGGWSVKRFVWAVQLLDTVLYKTHLYLFCRKTR